MKSDRNWTTAALYALFGCVLLGGFATLAGTLAIRLRCGAGGRPSSVFAGLQIAAGSGSGYTLAAGCLAPVQTARVIDAVGLLAIATGVAVVAIWWIRYRQSDQHFVHELHQRAGLAKPGEIRRHVSTKAVLSRAAILRPGAAHPTPQDVGWKVGQAHGRDVYVSIEDSVVVEGAPRSGKGYRFIINAILDWSGPLITTSTRNDNLAATMAARARRGQVTVFDPQGLSGVRSTLRISPVAGCDDPLVADQRGQAIVAGTALGASKTNAEWAHVASTVLSRLLHAAAVSGLGADAVARWGSNPRLALEAVNILTNHGTPGWGDDLDAIINGDERLLASSWFGVSGAVRPLAIPSIREAMTPGKYDTFEPDTFLAGENTLFLIGTGTGAGSVGGFLGALLDDVVETARRKALASQGSRLNPPLALVLDEIANMFSWPALPQIMSDGGGIGISTIVVLQALSQAETAWSKAEADTIWSAATAKLLLGGASDVDHLRDVESLLGVRRLKSTGHSYSDANTTTSVHEEKVPVLSVDEIRRLPASVGLLSYRTRRGILLDLKGWTERADAKTIQTGKTATEASQQLVFADQYAATRERRSAAARGRS